MDISQVEKLIKLMNQHTLVELSMETKDGKVSLKKQVDTPAAIRTVQSQEPILEEPQPSVKKGRASQSQEGKGEAGAKAEENIASPMVGTFYRASAPDAEPYVRVNQHVEPNDVVCIIEAMKVMNEIKADRRGTIIEILVENGDAVEFGQPLFKIKG